MTTKRASTKIARWLLPTTFAPAISTSGAVGLYSLFGGHDGIARWAILILGLLIGTLWAAVYSLILTLVDVALLALRQRMLPGGKRGWGLSAGSPLLVFVAYSVFPPASFYKYGPWGVAAAVVAPMIAVAVVTRVALGERAHAAE
jgi:hypothetical protein